VNWNFDFGGWLSAIMVLISAQIKQRDALLIRLTSFSTNTIEAIHDPIDCLLENKYGFH
jgi:hypothetical protein